VRCFAAMASHLPERAEVLEAVSDSSSPASQAMNVHDLQTRPLLLLPQAEPAEVTALIPDGPPRRFRWRGTSYEVAGAQGPERIGAEWWRRQDLTRDYFLVEDADGQRFWLFREGLYGRETAAARWFVHGLFA